MKLNEQLISFADAGHPLACFSFAKEAFDNLKDGLYGAQSQQTQDLLLKKSISLFEFAAKKGVSSAMFYLGMINLEGRFVAKDAVAAHSYFIEGAARNNAYCYFELSRIYSGEDDTINLIDEEPSKTLQFLYLKRSAEEGFVHAQHCLA